jgi:thiol-disulfide isomerase/thioredoxin
MLARRWLTTCCLCFIAGPVFAAPVFAAAEPWVMHGRVLDPQGRPAAHVEVSTFWNANGVPLAEIQRIEKLPVDVRDSQSASLSQNEGRMEPWGNPTTTDADGRFSIKMNWTNYFVLAFDQDRQHGALYVANSQNSSDRAPVDIKLGPLVRLHGRVHVPKPLKDKWTMVVVRLPESEQFPLRFNRLTWCSSAQSRFEFLLPPGNYCFEANAGDRDTSCELAEYVNITIPTGKSDVDAGVLELGPRQPGRGDRIREAQAKGTWPNVDPKKLYGQPAPKWHATDTRGIPKDAQLADFKGKWVLVYFWGPWCHPCLGREIPALMKFYDAHAADRDRFEIVSICTSEPQIKTMADLDRELKPVVKAVWHGRPIPFPIVLDNTLESTEHFGLTASKLLFNPEGRLVPGDEKTMAEKLKH